MESNRRELIRALREIIESQNDDEATRSAADEAFIDAFYMLVRDVLDDEGGEPF